MYNAPINGEDLSAEYHWHIAFYPPMRSANKVKYNASSETGAWAHCNPTCPEDTSVELREAHARFMQEK
jgi:UDPglucose--hexose-1-phosphate uridylyltransferase